MTDPRTWDDEKIDEAYNVAAAMAATGGGTWQAAGEAVLREAAIRAEIRMNRVASGMITVAELAEKHDAAWYASRQTEEQWLAEMGGQA